MNSSNILVWYPNASPQSTVGMVCLHTVYKHVVHGRAVLCLQWNSSKEKARIKTVTFLSVHVAVFEDNYNPGCYVYTPM